MGEFEKYRRTNIAEMRPYVQGEDLSHISVSSQDDPETDMGMVARNPQNHDDQWYVARKYFEDNFARLYDPAALMSFSQAMEALRDGYNVSRQGWNGSGMFLLIIWSWAPYGRKFAEQYAPDAFSPGPFIAIRMADLRFVPWLASQTDMLAHDWQIAF